VRHFCVQSISGAKMSQDLGTDAKVSRGHFGVLEFYDGIEMSNEHFGTTAKMSWVRSVHTSFCFVPLLYGSPDCFSFCIGS